MALLDDKSKRGRVDEGIGVALRDGAHVHSSLDLEVSLRSPGWPPRILHIPELHSALSSVPCQQHCVVYVLRGLPTVLHTVHPGHIPVEGGNNLESNRDGADVVELLRELRLIALSDIEASISNISNRCFLLEVASLALPLVGVDCVWLESSRVPYVFEGVRRQSPVATMVVEAARTVDQLLLREGYVSALAQDIPV